MLRMLAVIISTCFLGVVENARAAGEIAPEEWPFLPTWCRYTQTDNPYGPKESVNSPSPKAQQLIDGIGREGYANLHHYCWGLAQLQRSHNTGLSQAQRQFLRQSAIRDIYYVLNNSPRNFVLRPELLTKTGLIFFMLGDYGKAERALTTAISEKPGYWPPYGYLSDVYVKQGRPDKARKVLQDGLRVAPGAKGLQTRLQALK